MTSMAALPLMRDSSSRECTPSACRIDAFLDALQTALQGADRHRELQPTIAGGGGATAVVVAHAATAAAQDEVEEGRGEEQVQASRATAPPCQPSRLTGCCRRRW